VRRFSVGPDTYLSGAVVVTSSDVLPTVRRVRGAHRLSRTVNELRCCGAPWEATASAYVRPAMQAADPPLRPARPAASFIARG
jgi:hypothetical protein